MSSATPVKFSVLLIAVLALTTVTVGAVQATAATGETVSTPSETDGVSETDWDIATNSSLSATVQENGDARWSLSTYFNLSSSNETAAYRELEDVFLSGGTVSTESDGTTTSGLGIGGFERAAESVNRHTDREMELTDVQRTSASEARVESGTGRLTVQFTWTNFARQDGNQLIIDDVLQTQSGELWLPRLYDGQRLTITAPSEYGVFDSGDDVSPDEGQLRWDGPREFSDEPLRATFIGPNDGGVTPGGVYSEILILAILLAVVAIVLAVVFTQADKVGNKLPTPPDTSAENTDDNGRSGDADSPHPETDDPADADEAEELDVELLSDEERVERLLSKNGGRMKQANIVKETDWSNAKVSQLLSSMEEEDRINKLRIGRENLISFPDEDITNTGE